MSALTIILVLLVLLSIPASAAGIFLKRNRLLFIPAGIISTISGSLGALHAIGEMPSSWGFGTAYILIALVGSACIIRQLLAHAPKHA